MKFYVSFGYQYAVEAHPSWVSGRVPEMRRAHPDNWIEVEAPDEYSARVGIMGLLGNNAWSMMYGEEEWGGMDRSRFFPGECILSLSFDRAEAP